MIEPVIHPIDKVSRLSVVALKKYSTCPVEIERKIYERDQRNGRQEQDR